MIIHHLRKAVLLAAFLLLPHHHAMAALACTATMTDMNFGNVTVINNQNVDITGTVSINCTGASANQQLRLCLHLCEGSGGMDNTDINPRYMNTASGLQYNIFTDSAFTQIWGARGSAGQTYCNNASWNIWNLVFAASPFADASGNYSGTITAYGRVFSGQMSMSAGIPQLLSRLQYDRQFQRDKCAFYGLRHCRTGLHGDGQRSQFRNRIAAQQQCRFHEFRFGQLHFRFSLCRGPKPGHDTGRHDHDAPDEACQHGINRSL